MPILRASPFRIFIRSYATPSGAPTPSSLLVFDRKLKQVQRDRAATNIMESRKVDYLRDLVADQMVDRMLFVNRNYHHILDLGSGSGFFANALAKMKAIPGSDDRNRITERFDKISMVDMAAKALHRDDDLPFNEEFRIERIQKDEEHFVPDPKTYDAAVSVLSLHWINNLPKTLKTIKESLKDDCPFIGAMIGGDSLYELRTALQLAEMERRGGVSPRVSPLADVRDVGGLMQSAGFKLLTIDIEDTVVDYPDMFSLLEDLQQMGENNAVLTREMGPISRDTLMAAQAIYKELHGNEDGTIPATFRIIFMIGWSPGDRQPTALKRGSAQYSMKQVFEHRPGKSENDRPPMTGKEKIIKNMAKDHARRREEREQQIEEMERNYDEERKQGGGRGRK